MKTDQKQFDDWFSGSCASNNGQPISLFHGAKVDFDVFDFAKARDGAHWFTSVQEHAAFFGPYLKEFFVVIRNPMVIDQDDLDEAWDDAHPDGEQDDRYLLPRDFVTDFVEQAKSLGHDGLIILEMGDLDAQPDMYLPFTTDQIRLASSCPVDGLVVTETRRDLQKQEREARQRQITQHSMNSGA